jgi:hypothetical protein
MANSNTATSRTATLPRTANVPTARRSAPAPRHHAATAPRSPAPAPRRGLFARFVAGLMAARQRQADAEIARYLATTGGKFTDRVEREVLDRLG